MGREGNGGAAAFLGGIKEAAWSIVGDGLLVLPAMILLRKAPEGGVPAKGEGLLLSLPRRDVLGE